MSTTVEESPVLEKLDKITSLLKVAKRPAPKPTPEPRRLYRHPKTGIYHWRRWDELLGRRVSRTTKTRDESIAIILAARFENEYQRRRAGLAVYDSFAKPLGEAVEHWIRALSCSEYHREIVASRIRRAVDLLELRTFADLDDMQRLEKNLLALEGQPGPRGPFTKLTLRQAFQGTLRQFSKWCAANRRYVPTDPLAQWELLHVPATHPHRQRRAVAPTEMARALLAAETLDGIHRRPYPTAIFFKTLLITGARSGAVFGLDVAHLLRDQSRLDTGPSVGKKRRGVASLDAATLVELLSFLGDRTSGPLFPSSHGSRLERCKTLDDWREAVTFGLVDELWPEDELEQRTIEWVHHVTYALIHGEVPQVGGNPRRLRAETIRAREEHDRRILALAARLREAVAARMVGVDLHALRKTHRTWSETAGVHPLLIDKQIGHATAAGGAALEAARALIVSPTGRKHYVDMGLSLIDARRSAEAVRKLLDDAEREILAQGSVFSTASQASALAPIIDFATKTVRKG